jgi:hypothetical protein
MSCRELKSLVASNSEYAIEFKRLINSISEDHFARLLLEEHEKSGILDPKSSFVFQKTLLCRNFAQVGFIKEADDYYIASLTLTALIVLMKTMFALHSAGEKERTPVGELYIELMRNVSFQSAIQDMSQFFAV